MYKPFVLKLVFFVCLVLSPFAAAQLVDVSACRDIGDRLERFDCYESLGREDAPMLVEEESGEALPVTETAEEVAEVVPERVQRFGLPENRSRVVDEEGGDSVLLATIASLDVHNYQQWLITLENGQVWRQMLSKRFNLKEGDAVRIVPSRWGTDYRLTAPHLAGYIQVERVE